MVCFRYIIVNTLHKGDKKDDYDDDDDANNNKCSADFANKISDEELERNRTFRKPGRKWKDNTKTDLKQIQILGVE
jgi:hypothetical protein